MYEKSLFVTGHRPPDLGGWDEDNDTAKATKIWLWNVVMRAYNQGKRNFISGLATGTDIWFAEAVVALKEQFHDIKLIVAIPYPSQSERWADFNKKRWERLVNEADAMHIINPDPAENSPKFIWVKYLHGRNQWMVDNGTTGCAVWNGKEKGGTFDCLKRAKKAGRKVLIYNPDKKEEMWT